MAYGSSGFSSGGGEREAENSGEQAGSVNIAVEIQGSAKEVKPLYLLCANMHYSGKHPLMHEKVSGSHAICTLARANVHIAYLASAYCTLRVR